VSVITIGTFSVSGKGGFRALDRLFPDDELILLMQSSHWQEEPDLMAKS
jgi:hypothetical protein